MNFISYSSLPSEHAKNAILENQIDQEMLDLFNTDLINLYDADQLQAQLLLGDYASTNNPQMGLEPSQISYNHDRSFYVDEIVNQDLNLDDFVMNELQKEKEGQFHDDVIVLECNVSTFNSPDSVSSQSNCQETYLSLGNLSSNSSFDKRIDNGNEYPIVDTLKEKELDDLIRDLSELKDISNNNSEPSRNNTSQTLSFDSILSSLKEVKRIETESSDDVIILSSTDSDSEDHSIIVKRGRKKKSKNSLNSEECKFGSSFVAFESDDYERRRNQNNERVRELRHIDPNKPMVKCPHCQSIFLKNGLTRHLKKNKHCIYKRSLIQFVEIDQLTKE